MKSLLLVAIVLPTAVVCSLPVVAADAALAPQTGLLLLTNGELLEGEITAAGDYYDVQVRDGQLRVRRAQVALIAQDVLACYRFKRGEIQIERAQDHLDLADWCMRNKLFDEAAAEIVDARRADATHPKIPLLETRLRLAREAPRPKPATPADENLAPAAKEPAQKPAEIASRDLPPACVEHFTNSIQPLLLNSCTGSGCHSGQTASAMRLERMPANRYTGRKSTQRNLRSVLSQIDRDNPLQSRLLAAPLGAHGGASKAIFGERQQAQYAQLVRWTYLVSGAAPPPTEPTFADRTAPLLERGPHETPPRVVPAQQIGAIPSADAATAASITQASAESLAEPGRLPANAGAVSVNDAAMARAQAALLESADMDASGAAPGTPNHLPPGLPTNAKAPPGQPDGAYVPQDPFDPEIFNRRYFGR
jgi:hypothetical protein